MLLRHAKHLKVFQMILTLSLQLKFLVFLKIVKPDLELNYSIGTLKTVIRFRNNMVYLQIGNILNLTHNSQYHFKISFVRYKLVLLI